jgi:phosphoribosylanthranilate isomerase
VTRASGGERVFVKICGITSARDAEMAVAAGADALGFVFWPQSPRQVSLEDAARISAEVPPFVVRVGVFVNAARDDLARAVDVVGLDVLQLHGDEPPAALEGLPRRVLKALRVGPTFSSEDAFAYAGRAAGLLLDAHRPGNPGGTGAVFDWARVKGLRDRVPFLLLAGGLTPDNVGEAIETVHPDGVDVSTGVESSPGRKDPVLMRAFVEAARTSLARRS